MSRLIPSGSFALCGFLLFAPALAQADDMAPTALNSLSSAPAALASAPVMDQNCWNHKFVFHLEIMKSLRCSSVGVR